MKLSHGTHVFTSESDLCNITFKQRFYLISSSNPCLPLMEPWGSANTLWETLLWVYSVPRLQIIISIWSATLTQNGMYDECCSSL